MEETFLCNWDEELSSVSFTISCCGILDCGGGCDGRCVDIIVWSGENRSTPQCPDCRTRSPTGTISNALRLCVNGKTALNKEVLVASLAVTSDASIV